MVQTSLFRNANPKERNQLLQHTQLLYNAVDYFKDYFVGKEVVYCTKDSHISLRFSKTNFMYLCGLYYPKG
ncbi:MULTISPECIES: hypothetical protein [unclassified Facklamia]|uniref:hypothetical protein n=1 Tax=Aerococcaceae TaxID=186827 RepID=UPI0013BC73A8|nr:MULTISPECIES: hypothetical protein [unclassified Facklamia]MBS4462557.1 hypothetical protein [Aerococcaceae bacterium zg-B36]NEW63769.1 hypothetical protein [Facklamia sp. 252]NEW67240.1 hypothetical protein [Facklamia sp. 253]QQD66224.1 hypothetical protein JDW14_03745 [Aerococcaceae bacterium zg-252]